MKWSVWVNSIRQVRSWLAVPAIVAVATLGVGTTAQASLIIAPTFGSSITTDPNAVGIEGAINEAIATIEGDITSPHNIAVSIYFTEMSGGLGESDTGYYSLSYQQYYNAFKAIATQPNQLTALASLGPAPTSPASLNPVTGGNQVAVTSAEARNLGFSGASGFVSVGSGTYDSEISLNTSITYPPQADGGTGGSTYGLEAVANHEIDEALGIGGAGSTIGDAGFSGNPGDLDLYRYICSIPTSTLIATLTCPSGDVSRSYTGTEPSGDSPYSYFSINGGLTVLSFFNQSAGADYGDWLSNCTDFTVCRGNGLPNGFNPQVQDAYGGPGTNPTLGVNEVTAFNAIGYDLLPTSVPEPSSLLLFGSALAIVAWSRRRLA